MKKQLEKLATEMLNEVKDLKNLAKKELPEVVKEYINFNLIIHISLAIFLGLITVIFTGMVVYGIFLDKGEAHDVYCFIGGICSLLFGFFTCINIYELLQYKLMPRRMAIKAITSLFNGE